MPLTIAVTGANGLIGSQIVATALADGHKVVGLDAGSESKLPPQEGYTFKTVDLTDHAAFLSACEGCDALVHLAAVYNLQDPKGPETLPLLREFPDEVIHNTNSAMSWNALSVAGKLGIKRVSLASSVNSIGLIYSKRPRFRYIPLDEDHPCEPEDPYSVCKLECEIQASAFVRRYPGMRVATIRPHWVIPESLAYNPDKLSPMGGHPKDLWGWVSVTAVARAFLLGLTAPESTFPVGHESFFAVAPTMVRQSSSIELFKEHYPEVTDIRGDFSGNRGFFDCSKAERMLGWTEKAFPWSPK